jgi:hypothetical protein
VYEYIPLHQFARRLISVLLITRQSVINELKRTIIQCNMNRATLHPSYKLLGLTARITKG